MSSSLDPNAHGQVPDKIIYMQSKLITPLRTADKSVMANKSELSLVFSYSTFVTLSQTKAKVNKNEYIKVIYRVLVNKSRKPQFAKVRSSGSTLFVILCQT